MTIRSELGRKKRTVLLIAIAGMGYGLAGALFCSRPIDFPIPPLFGFFVAIGAFLYGAFYIRCPNCTNSLSELVLSSGHPFALPLKIKFCPYCGVNLDSEIRGKIS